jgi:type VI secretion system protein ImpB
MSNIYNKIKTVRKPRVQISYDIDDNGVSVKKELPFVVGVLGDFSGNTTKPLKSFKKRKFVNIHGENFNEVMEGMTPGISIKVDNKIKEDGSQLNVDLDFKSMNDFSPGEIAKKIEPLNNLLKIRSDLQALVSKAERSEDLEKALEHVLQNNDALKDVADTLKSKTQKKE